MSVNGDGDPDELPQVMREVERAAGTAPTAPQPPVQSQPAYGAPQPPTYGAPQPVYGAPGPTYGAAPPPAYPNQPDQVLVTIGDIAVTPTNVITPVGRRPLRGLVWMVQNNTVTTDSIPTYAIVLCVVFAVFCLLGLLFLLIKERKTQGFVTVSVQGEGFYHATQLPVSYPAQIADIEGRVGYCRALTAAAV